MTILGRRRCGDGGRRPRRRPRRRRRRPGPLLGCTPVRSRRRLVRGRGRGHGAGMRRAATPRKVVLAREVRGRRRRPIPAVRRARPAPAGLPRLHALLGRRLRRAPAPSCSSPAGDVVRAHPMAGTAPRSGDPERRRPAGRRAARVDEGPGRAPHHHRHGARHAAAVVLLPRRGGRAVGRGHGQRAAPRHPGGGSAARARRPRCSSWCAALHPTPAVGGGPRAAALALIDELEGSTGAATPGRSGGSTPPATASGPSASAAPRSTAPSPGSSPASACVADSDPERGAGRDPGQAPGAARRHRPTLSPAAAPRARASAATAEATAAWISACTATLAARSVGTCTTRRPARADRGRDGAGDLLGGRRAARRAARGPRRGRRGRRRGVCRRAARSGRSGASRPGAGTRRCRPPSLSTTTTVEVDRLGQQPEQGVGVVEEGDVADQHAPSGTPVERDPDGGRHHPVDAVGAPVGDAPRTSARGAAYHSTSRTGIDDDTTSAPPAGTAASDGAGRRPARWARRGRRGPTAMAVGRVGVGPAHATATPSAIGRARRPRRGRGDRPAWRRGCRARRRRASSRDAVGIEPRRRRASTATCQASSDRQPRREHLGGRRRPRRSTTSGAAAATQAGRGARRRRGRSRARRPGPGTRCGDRRAPASRAARPARGPPSGSATPPPATMSPGASRARRPPGHRRRRRLGVDRPRRACHGRAAVPAGGQRAGRRRPAARGTAGSGAPDPGGRALAPRAPARPPASATVGATDASGAPGSANQRTAAPKRWVWSMVWGAPDVAQLGRPIGGARRSAAPGRGAASTTAGCSSTAAVPLVVSTTAGPARGPTRGRAPRTPPERSSWCTCTPDAGRRRPGPAPSASTASPGTRRRR